MVVDDLVTNAEKKKQTWIAMIIKSLVDNEKATDAFESEHGLSLYVETSRFKILFDMGQKSGIFAKNASKLGVDLSKIDFAVVSHGHFDHGGGLKTFLDINDTAKVYINRRAFERHYAVMPDGSSREIGLDDSLMKHDRIVIVETETYEICDGVEIFSGVSGKKLFPSDNARLQMADGENLVPDTFLHEQNLVIREGTASLLLGGCAHNGILNIIDHYNSLGRPSLTHVVSGLHLHSYSMHTDEDPAILQQLAQGLLSTKAVFHTCHCTGIGPYNVLRAAMGEAISYLAAGGELVITA
jgi:7,8-dihydropterin-6-yl-methyl-4-(beta-D-ribofuranosyl)aminobenzene 5'-phosphate synthase